MINFICGFICGSVSTLLLYRIKKKKRIQEEQDRANKCISKYNEYRIKIRTLEYQKHGLEEKLKSSGYSDFDEVK